MTTTDQPGEQMRTFLSDRPVEESSKDYLWTDGRTRISDHIQRIARHIVGALLTRPVSPTGKQSDSMTFAVYGKWGIGKSSALYMLKEWSEKLAGEKLSPQEIEQRLIFCWYNASHFESLAREPLFYDAYSTLAFTILKAVGANSPETRRELEAAAIGFAMGDHITGHDTASGNISKTGEINKIGPLDQRVILTLSRSIEFDKIVKKHLRDEQDNPRVLVILVDDLDRCQKSFIWEILNAIQGFNAIDNVFFVLAVDQARLEKAIQEQTATIEGFRDPDYALEKYIQQYVSLPAIDEELLTIYIRKLQQDIPHAQILEIIEENIGLFISGLHELTPRSVKRFINTEDIHIEQKLQQLPPEQNPERQKRQRAEIFKEILLAYSWPLFARQYLLPARSIESEQTNFRELEQYCREFHANHDRDRLNFELKRLANRISRTEWEKLDEKLAHYLGTEPYWFFTIEKPAGSGALHTGRDGESAKSDAPFSSPTEENREEIPEDLQKIAQEIEQRLKGNIPVGEEEDVDSKFRRLYMHSQAVANDPEQSLPLAVEILKLVSTHKNNFNKNHGSQIGNVAIDAESFREYNLADMLFQLALELNPEHSNVMQNYVDFIIDARLRDHYEIAEEYLAKLKTGIHAQHRPERTLLLSIRLARLTGKTEQIDEVKHDLDTAIQAFSQEPTNRRQLGTLMSLLKELGEFDIARDVSRVYYDHAADITNKYVAVRGLADALAASSAREDEYEAMDIYHFLLDNNLDCDEAQADRTDMQHNYAFLLYKYDFDNVAGSLWFEAYKQRSTDANIRRIYSDYLMRAGRADLAAAVVDGKPL